MAPSSDDYEVRYGCTHAWRKLRQRARALPLACAACGVERNPSAPRCTPTAPELDHILPVKSGGIDTLGNVQTDVLAPQPPQVRPDQRPEPAAVAASDLRQGEGKEGRVPFYAEVGRRKASGVGAQGGCATDG